MSKNKLVIILVMVLGVVDYFRGGTFLQSMIDHSENGYEVSENAYVHFLDTGTSDSIVIEYQDKFALIDGGDNDDGRYVSVYLRELGAEKLSFLEMTHAHADHVGGLDDIVRDFEVDEVFVGNGEAETKSYTSFIQELSKKGLHPSVPLDGAKLYWDENTYFQFFNTEVISENINENSIITLFVHGDTAFLFTGDAFQKQEEKYMNELPEIDVLKIGHHGSYTSTSPKFIRKVKPEYAIILCKEENDYGYPHRETVATLHEQGVEFYTSGEEGEMVFKSNGNWVDLMMKVNVRKLA